MSNSNINTDQIAARDVRLDLEAGILPAQTNAHACNSDAKLCVDKGASLSITAPSNYKTTIKTQPLRCAIDSLYISYKGEINPDIETQLNLLKEMAQDDDPSISSEAYIYISDHKFEVAPKGSNQFSFILRDNWFSIQISKTKEPPKSKKPKKQQLPLAYVQISSELLTFTNLDEILTHIDSVVNQIGNVRDYPYVSRLDLCMDFVPKFDVEQIRPTYWKTRATKKVPYYEHNKLTGWQIGSDLIMARMYNKSLEINKSKKDYLKPLWLESQWDGITDVWRMEFQLRRGFLKEFGIHYSAQIKGMSPQIWKYVCTKWLELVTPLKDSNHCRWPVTQEWQEITNTFTTLDCVIQKEVSKMRLPSNQYLFVNGFAALTSFMASRGIPTFDEAIGEYFHEAELYHKSYKDKSLEQYLTDKAIEKTLRYNTKMKE